MHLVDQEGLCTSVLLEDICAYRRNVCEDLEHYARIWPGIGVLAQESFASPLWRCCVWQAAEMLGCRHFSIDLISAAIIDLRKPCYSSPLTSRVSSPYSACIANLPCLICMCDVLNVLLDGLSKGALQNRTCFGLRHCIARWLEWQCCISRNNKALV